MLPTVFVASLISEPNIKALSSKNKSWSFFRVMHNPLVCSILNAVHQENSRIALLEVFRVMDSEEGYDVAILGNSLVGFKMHFVECRNFLKSHAKFWIGEFTLRNSV